MCLSAKNRCEWWSLYTSQMMMIDEEIQDLIVMWKKIKWVFMFCFVLTDWNTISEFLNNTASKQTFHTKTIHFYNSSSLQYIHLYNIKLNKQTTFIFTLSLSQ